MKTNNNNRTIRKTVESLLAQWELLTMNVRGGVTENNVVLRLRGIVGVRVVVVNRVTWLPFPVLKIRFFLFPFLWLVLIDYGLEQYNSAVYYRVDRDYIDQGAILIYNCFSVFTHDSFDLFFLLSYKVSSDLNSHDLPYVVILKLCPINEWFPSPTCN